MDEHKRQKLRKQQKHHQAIAKRIKAEQRRNQPVKPGTGLTQPPISEYPDGITYLNIPMELVLCKQLSRADLCVYGLVCIYKKKPHGCYLTNQGIAAKLRLKPETVRAALRKLHLYGLIERHICSLKHAASNRSLFPTENFRWAGRLVPPEPDERKFIYWKPDEEAIF